MKNFIKNLADGGLAEDIYTAMERILDEDTNKEKMVNKQELIDKVRNWLEKHTYDEEYWLSEGNGLCLGNLINNVCKYLEEEL